jgi:hypothetical protein
MKMNKKTKRIVVGSAAFLAPAILMFSLVLVPLARRRAEEAQCARERAVAELLVGFLQQHTNSWPTGWSDLRSSMDPQLVNADECISVWQQCVDVDWSLSSQDLVGSPHDTMPQAILCRDASAYARVAARTPEHKREPEPNTLIWEFINKKEANISLHPRTARRGPG